MQLERREVGTKKKKNVYNPPVKRNSEKRKIGEANFLHFIVKYLLAVWAHLHTKSNKKKIRLKVFIISALIFAIFVNCAFIWFYRAKERFTCNDPNFCALILKAKAKANMRKKFWEWNLKGILRLIAPLIFCQTRFVWDDNLENKIWHEISQS